MSPPPAPLRLRLALPEPERIAKRMPARAEVLALVVGAKPDVAEQPREQRAVDLLVGRRGLVGMHPELGRERGELRVDLAPFAQPRWDRKFPCRSSTSLRLTSCADGVPEELPQLEERQEIRALVGELLVRAVGGLPRARTPLGRILDGERRSDDEDLLQAVLPLRLDDDARDPRSTGTSRAASPPQ